MFDQADKASYRLTGTDKTNRTQLPSCRIAQCMLSGADGSHINGRRSSETLENVHGDHGRKGPADYGIMPPKTENVNGG